MPMFTRPAFLFLRSACHDTSDYVACERDVGTCAVARHTWNDDEHREVVAALAPPTLTRSVLFNPSES